MRNNEGALMAIGLTFISVGLLSLLVGCIVAAACRCRHLWHCSNFMCCEPTQGSRRRRCPAELILCGRTPSANTSRRRRGYTSSAAGGRAASAGSSLCCRAAHSGAPASAASAGSTCARRWRTRRSRPYRLRCCWVMRCSAAAGSAGRHLRMSGHTATPPRAAHLCLPPGPGRLARTAPAPGPRRRTAPRLRPLSHLASILSCVCRRVI